MKKNRKIAMALAIAAVLNLGYASHTVLAEEIGITQKQAMEKITVIGNQSIDTATIQKNLAGLPPEQMKDAVIKLYDEVGYRLVRASVSASDDGTSTVSINETLLNKVYVQGNKYSSQAAVLKALPALKENRPVNIRNLSGEILLANENAFRKMSVNFKTIGGDKVDAYVTVSDKSSNKFILSVDNTGDRYTGNYRTSLSYLDGNVSGSGQTMALSFTTSPDHFSDVKQFGLFYNVPLAGSKDNIYFTASYSDVNSGRILSQDFFSIDAAGKGTSFGLNYVKNLTRTENVTESLALGLNYNQYKNNTTLYFIDTPIPIGVDIDSMPFNLTYRKNILSPATKESVSYSVGFVQNIPGGGKNSDSQYNLYRTDTKANYSFA